MNAVITPISQYAALMLKAFQRISSFDQKPANGGIPAIARVAMPMVANVQGMYGRKPPILRMSCSPPMP